jgi:hypothetical protein
MASSDLPNEWPPGGDLRTTSAAALGVVAGSSEYLLRRLADIHESFLRTLRQAHGEREPDLIGGAEQDLPEEAAAAEVAAAEVEAAAVEVEVAAAAAAEAVAAAVLREEVAAELPAQSAQPTTPTS